MGGLPLNRPARPLLPGRYASFSPIISFQRYFVFPPPVAALIFYRAIQPTNYRRVVFEKGTPFWSWNTGEYEFSDFQG
jgi:hypothetical protein